MLGRTTLLIVASVLLIVSGCATLSPDFEKPTVTVTAIRIIPAESIAPQFEIDLHIVNPNRTALELVGIAYNLKLEGYKILTGVANDLPSIEGYGEGDVALIATTDLFSSIRFLADLMKSQRQSIAYNLEAKLDLGSFYPTIHVGEEGKIDLSGRPR
jgi:LEA14-like dessication related protein